MQICKIQSNRYCNKMLNVNIVVEVRVRAMVFNATFNNISVISLWLVLLIDETRVTGAKNRPAESHVQTLSHKVVSSTPRLM